MRGSPARRAAVVRRHVASCDDESSTTPVIKTGAVTNITELSAIVSGTITDDGNAKITVAGFVYSNVKYVTYNIR